MQAFASELTGSGIRVNAVCPTQTDAPMWVDDRSTRLCGPELEAPTRRDAVEISTNTTLNPVSWAEPRDVSNAVLFPASDEARYITEATLPVDAGTLARVVDG
jgi:(+)-trans-carveol dehydrogenase/(-)-trans-carveol dehydrogenase